jgi:hypothetical protein
MSSAVRTRVPSHPPSHVSLPSLRVSLPLSWTCPAIKVCIVHRARIRDYSLNNHILFFTIRSLGIRRTERDMVRGLTVMESRIRTAWTFTCSMEIGSFKSIQTCQIMDNSGSQLTRYDLSDLFNIRDGFRLRSR